MAEQLSKNLKLLVLSAYFVLFGLIISKILGYAYRLIIARYFGPEIYGQFSIALMVISVFIAISSFGLSEGLTRFIPIYRAKKDKSSINYLFRSSLKITLVSSILFSALLFLNSGYIANSIFNNSELTNLLRVFSLSLPFSIISVPLLSSLRAYEKIKEYSFTINIFQNVSRVALILILVLIGMNSSAISYSYLISIILTSLVAYYYCKTRIPEVLLSYKLNSAAKKSLLNNLFSYSLPLLFASIVYILFFWADSFSIGYLKGALEVGLYNSAASIAMLLLIAPELFMQLFFPLISKQTSLGKSELVKELSKQVTKWIFLINLPLVSLFILFPGAGINLLFGEEYLHAVDALRILSIGVLIYSISIPSYNLVNSAGKSKKTLFYLVLATILNLTLNFILIPMDSILFLDNSNGLVGASLATAISMLFASALFIFESTRILGSFPLRRKMINSLLACILSIILLLIIKQYFLSTIVSTISLGAIFLVFNAILLVLFKSLDSNDISLIKKAIQKIKSIR